MAPVTKTPPCRKNRSWPLGSHPFHPRQSLPYAGKPGHPENGVDADIMTMLEQRLGRLHARQRLGIEREFEGKVFSRGRRFFHIENLYSAST